MRCGTVTHMALVAALACLTASCTPPRAAGPPSPGCLVHLFTRPGLQGSGIPVARDTPELDPAWSGKISSARIVWGTWRLFASPEYKDFMGDYSSPAEVPLLKPAPGVASLKCIAPEPPPPAPPPPPGLYY
jgi:hypothetical protein